MCGIVGILSNEDVADRLLDGLKRLEYRGYDSAGIATDHDGQIDRRRASGKLINLAKELAAHPLPGHTGIAHTRWATHGGPTTNNAHPHATGDHVAVVHNGIIENFKPLREELIATRAGVHQRDRYRGRRASDQREGRGRNATPADAVREILPQAPRRVRARDPVPRSPRAADRRTARARRSWSAMATARPISARTRWRWRR